MLHNQGMSERNDSVWVTLHERLAFVDCCALNPKPPVSHHHHVRNSDPAMAMPYHLPAKEFSDFEDFDEHQAPYLVPLQGYVNYSDMDVTGEE